MSKPDGGAAFPRPRSVDGSGDREYALPAQEGMSLRDWFAGQVIGALVGVSPDESVAAAQYSESQGLTLHQLTAQTAYSVADALLAEREKP